MVGHSSTMSPVRCELLFFGSSAGTLEHRNVERCTKILSAGPIRFLVKVAQGSLPEDWMPVKFEISAIVILLSSSLMNEVSQADEFIHAEAKFCWAAFILCMFLVAEPFRDASRFFFYSSALQMLYE